MELAKYIEHTLLKPDVISSEIDQLCQDAINYQFRAVCVPPIFVKRAATLLENNPTKVVSIVGFPMGYSAIAAKVEEVKRAIDEGVQEIDTVINLAAVKDGQWSHVYNDIDSVTRATHLKGKVLKVIVEAGLLTPSELSKVCDICVGMGVDYVKTSTGFHGTGATVSMVQNLRGMLPKRTKIKASGGIKTTEFAQELINAGANSIGTSSALKIIGVASTT
ncbi:MAG: deoxyribose-phosphate aldolase [Saprospiraceae bacterium]|nr:deoxyribose-phosphate aldolase [Saprospiraceae bacterium]